MIAPVPVPVVPAPDRLVARLAQLADLAPVGGTGSCRLALTDADRAARDLLCAWMDEAGLDVRIDRIGNIVGVWSVGADDPALAPVMTGSHLDTVATGGRYDGPYGVVSGLEVIDALRSAGVRTRRPVAVAAFTNEEGARFTPDMMGSLVYAGGLPLEAALGATDADGCTVGDELVRIGYQGVWPVPGPAPFAFVELHIEQGPVLEAVGADIGAVTSVQGISWQELTFTGQSNHAGTTPMHLRRDAGLAAARVAAHVPDLVAEVGEAGVGTVGRIELHPDIVNVVAGRATFTVDLRNTDDVLLRRAEERLVAFAHQLAGRDGLGLSVRSLVRFEPVRFDPDLVDLVEGAARDRGLRVHRLPSGAGHDAQMLARVCPAAMIFVPSAGGISHNPAEHTDPAQLHAGLAVLTDVLANLASR